MRGENRLHYRKVCDGADIAASAEIVFMEMRGRCRYRRNQQGR
jgi:hypothetical protein